MANMRGRKPARDVASHPLPHSVVLLAAAAKNPLPQLSHRVTEGAYRPGVLRHPIVADVPAYYRTKISALLRKRLGACVGAARPLLP